jgi:hypothetical protein
MRATERLNTSPSRCENAAGPADDFSGRYREGHMGRSDQLNGNVRASRRENAAGTIRNQAAHLPVGAERRSHETRDSDPAVPIPRPLSETSRARCGALEDRQLGGRRRPGRIPKARQTRRGSPRAASRSDHPCSRGAWTRSARIGSRLRQVRPVFPLESPRAGRRQDRSAGRGLVPRVSFQGRGADSGGRDVHRAGVSTRRTPAPPNPMPGGRDEGGRS